MLAGAAPHSSPPQPSPPRLTPVTVPPDLVCDPRCLERSPPMKLAIRLAQAPDWRPWPPRRVRRSGVRARLMSTPTPTRSNRIESVHRKRLERRVRRQTRPSDDERVENPLAVVYAIYVRYDHRADGCRSGGALGHRRVDGVAVPLHRLHRVACDVAQVPRRSRAARRHAARPSCRLRDQPYGSPRGAGP